MDTKHKWTKLVLDRYCFRLNYLYCTGNFYRTDFLLQFRWRQLNLVDCFFYSYIIYVYLSYFLNVLLRRFILLICLLVVAQSFYAHFCSHSFQPDFTHTALFLLPKYKTLGRIIRNDKQKPTHF